MASRYNSIERKRIANWLRELMTTFGVKSEQVAVMRYYILHEASYTALRGIYEMYMHKKGD